jgi:hypothetical protein
MYFKKLNIDFKINDFNLKDYAISYKLNSEKEFFKGTLYHTVDNNNDHLLEIIPKNLRHFFQIFHLKINCNVRAHIDHGPKTSINFYIKTPPCKTAFYSFIDSTKLRTIPLDVNNLKEEDCFVAKENEVWVLDISAPHSVVSLENYIDIDRNVICIQSYISFKHVLKMLNIK